jgi:hypothetical protein
MSPEEERWITIILEESRKAEPAGYAGSTGALEPRPPRRKRRPRSRRYGQTIRVRPEHLVERSRKHGLPML